MSFPRNPCGSSKKRNGYSCVRMQQPAPFETRNTLLDKMKRSFYRSFCWDVHDSQTNLSCMDNRSRSKKREFMAEFDYSPKIILSERHSISPSRQQTRDNHVEKQDFGFPTKIILSERHPMSSKQHTYKSVEKQGHNRTATISKHHRKEPTEIKNKNHLKNQGVIANLLLSSEPYESKVKTKSRRNIDVKRPEKNEDRTSRRCLVNGHKSKQNDGRHNDPKNTRYHNHCIQRKLQCLEKSHPKPPRYANLTRGNSRTGSICSSCQSNSYIDTTIAVRSIHFHSTETREKHCKQVYELSKDQCKSFKEKGYIKVNVKVKPNVSVSDFNIIIKKDSRRDNRELKNIRKE